MSGVEKNVIVAAVGMQTSVGLSAAETAANVRAKVMLFEEVPFQDSVFSSFVVARIPDDGLPELDDTVLVPPRLTSREQRMLRLATMPISECLAPIAPGTPPLRLAWALPELETLRPLDPLNLLQRLCLQTDKAIDEKASLVVGRGRAAGLTAISQAMQWITEGDADFVLAAGVDTYVDPYILATLDQEKRVKSEVNHDAFIPGEAAACLLLADQREAENAGLPILAHLTPVFSEQEAGHLYSDEPFLGDGLSEALVQLCEQGGLKEPIADAYLSMNGERYWGKQWGVAYLRCSDAFADEHETQHPADCFGDTGAAAGLLLVGLATLGISAGYGQSPCLVAAASDYGQCAVVAVHSPGVAA